LGDDLAVAEMHAVEGANRNRAATVSDGQFPE
jgi:hypothetical protein